MLAIKLTNPIIRGASKNLKALRQPFLGQLVRANSSSSDPKPNEYKAKALSLIDALPGNSIVSKTGFITVGATLSTWLVSKEIYMINEETVIATSFFIVVWYILKNGREPFNAWADSQINVITFLFLLFNFRDSL
ncbi:atp4 subunit B of the stator stalk of mitochondrial F1F0 ATP synthase [Entomophthora muscae]|uniref:Atp4 subunit B of the stator stalk of mitochondrial F1F0 ATP synthase n=1 Tax=Entomophthora muscae TaxID=34485 RepID=A0ACC2UA52_9FUNG|nr:atp4 subunit B of the stator stalk of mitochondrial F1F0 ATP synthase [Entomophthora muscae]